MICNISSCNEEFNKIVIPELKTNKIDYHGELFDFDCHDYRTLALAAELYKPDFIIVSGYAVNIEPILKALRNYSLIKKDNVVGSLDLVNLLREGTPQSVLAGVAFVCPPFELTSSAREAAPWRQAFQQRFKRNPSYVEAYAYDTGRILVAAYKRFGKVDENSIRRTLPFKGICGDIDVDQDGDLKTKLFVAHLDKNGCVERIGDKRAR